MGKQEMINKIFDCINRCNYITDGSIELLYGESGACIPISDLADKKYKIVIFVDTKLPYEGQISVFYHEYGHALCILNKCECGGHNEKHALKYQLKECEKLKNDWAEPLEWSMKKLKKSIESER